MSVSDAPWAAAASADVARGGGPAGDGRGGGGARGWAGAGGGRGGAGRGSGVAGRGFGRPRSGEGRKPRPPISLGEKLALIDIRDAGRTWPLLVRIGQNWADGSSIFRYLWHIRQMV